MAKRSLECGQASGSCDLHELAFNPGIPVMNSGKMFGGYHVGKESQISVYKNFTSLQKELREIEKNTKILQEKLNHSRSEMVKSSNKKQRSEQRVGSIKSEIEQLNLTRRLLNEELNVWKDFKSKKEESVSKYQTDLELWDSHLANLKQELNQDMTSQLSESEQRNLHKLNDDIKRLEEDYKNILKKKQKLNYSEEFSKKNNYIKLHESLVQELNELNKDEPMKTLETVSLTLDTLKKKKDSIQRQLKDIERAWVEAVKVVIKNILLFSVLIKYGILVIALYIFIIYIHFMRKLTYKELLSMLHT
ncbi:hypothetical protein C0J52_06239 [Blattella germanica]|nr:hypothetical protein C0J52_06239 [Blattella germanica]